MDLFASDDDSDGDSESFKDFDNTRLSYASLLNTIFTDIMAKKHLLKSKSSTIVLFELHVLILIPSKLCPIVEEVSNLMRRMRVIGFKNVSMADATTEMGLNLEKRFDIIIFN